MRFRFYIVCYAVLLSIRPSIKAQQLTDSIEIKSELISVKDGLSQGLVSWIIQDKEDFLWFGTKDGLNKYDGYNFTTYRNQADNSYSLPDNYVTALAEDDLGNIWVGTNTKGLFLFDKRLERFYPVKINSQSDSVSNNTIYRLQYFNGKLLVENTFFTIYDIGNFFAGNADNFNLNQTKICFDSRTLQAEHGDPKNNPLPFYSWLNKDSLWLIYRDSIFIYSPSNSGIFKKAQAFQNQEIGLNPDYQYNVIDLPQPGRFLFFSKGDLLVYDFNRKQLLKKINFTDGYPFHRRVIKGKDFNYFITSLDFDYLFNIKDFSLTPIKGKTGSHGLVDRNGILWMCTSGQGVVKIDYRKQLFRLAKGRPAIAWYINKEGNLFDRDWNHEPCIYNPYTQKSIPVLPIGFWKKGFIANEFIADDKGANWLIYSDDNRTKSFLVKYNSTGGKLIQKQLGDSITAESIKMIFDHDGNLWLSVTAGNKPPFVAKVNTQSLDITAVYSFPAKIQNYGHFVMGFWQDSHHVFWFATLQGLYSFNPDHNQEKEKWHHWSNIQGNANSLSNNQLLCILPDPKYPEKYLWLGTEGGGLNRFEIANGKFISYTDKDGLPNNVIYGLLSDNDGNLWMSTNNGLCCGLSLSVSSKEMDFNSREADSPFVVWGTEDGLPGNEFNRTEYCKLANGDLLFGGVDGMVLFNPKKVLEKEIAPAIVFTGLSVYNRTVSNKTDSNIISLPVSYAKSITLTHDKSMFTVSFAALEYRVASKKRYKYYLEGYDKNWIESGSKNEATYTNLSPGTYTLHVTGAGSTGVWNKAGASIKIIILPAWWQTWWFRLAMAVSTIMAVYVLYRYRLRQALKLQSLRNNIARDLHDEIGSTLSSISLYGESAKMMIPSEHPLNNVLSKISNSTNNMMEAMSDIVWAINTRNDKFDNLINRMNAFAYEVMEAKGCNVIFDANSETNKLKLNMEQRKNLYLLYKEIINNAAKHACCKNLWVSINLHHNQLKLLVKDDGVGFSLLTENTHKTLPPAPLQRKKEFGGNGLENLKKRAADLNAVLEIDSTPGKGTEIVLKMKL